MPGQVFALNAVARNTLSDQTYDGLKCALLVGRIEPGMTLTLRQIAQELGTSMMPVREAVARLVAEGALEVMPNRGLRIPLMSSQETDDLWTLRYQLEGEAAARAASRATPDDQAQIAALCQRVRSAAELGGVEAFLEANSTFQFAIYQAAQTRVFISLVEILRMRCAPHCTAALRYMLAQRPPYFSKTLRYHDELVRAIAQRDPDRARRIKQRDIVATRKLVERVAAMPAA
jgi:DNA-binding GntR family transcriptional regulator